MWIVKLLTEPSAIQAVIILSAVCALGLSMAKFRFRGISLGITFVFFAGILAGALGLKLDPQMVSYAESFGLILFVYTLGLQVGPGFVTTFKHGGTWLNILSLAVVIIGTIMAVVIAMTGWLPFADLMGVLCGATTNTPALGAAQQTLKQLGQPSAVAALSCAVTYPIGMVGVIIVLVIMRGWLQRHDKGEDTDHDEEAFITAYCVKNPALFGKDIYYVVHHSEHAKFVVSRIWREGKVILPNAQ
ncbi:MAG: transporter, partial [Alloprevotella sp.]